jgi:hypothetical protein
MTAKHFAYLVTAAILAAAAVVSLGLWLGWSEVTL